MEIKAALVISCSGSAHRGGSTLDVWTNSKYSSYAVEFCQLTKKTHVDSLEFCARFMTNPLLNQCLAKIDEIFL